MNAYQPIAKLKTNDVQAFNLLSADLRRNTPPVFEMVKMPDDGDAEKHLGNAIAALALYQDGAVPTVDLDRFAPDTLVRGVHPAEIGYGNFLARRLYVVPVLGLHAAYSSLDVVVGAAQSHRRGLCIRIDGEDVVLAGEHAVRQLAERVRDIGTLAGDCDLLIDFGKLQRFEPDSIVVAVLKFLRDIDGYGLSFRRIAIAGSSVVKYVSEAAEHENTTGEIRRQELGIWTRISRLYGWGRSISFSDYGIVWPEHMDNVKNKAANGKIRYTAGSKTYYIRGCRKDHVSIADQYTGLATRLVESPFYQADSYSYSDRFYWRASRGLGGTGCPGKCVQLDMNHHLTYVNRQLASLLGLSERERASEEFVDQFLDRY